MKKRNIVSASLVLASLVGCATPTTGIVPRNDEMYTVTRQGGGFWVTPDSLRVAAIQEGNEYCQKSGKKIRVMHSKDIPAGPLGRWPESEILFKCE